MNKQQVAEIIAVRYQFGHYFCRLLNRLIARVPDGHIKVILQANLSEEEGVSRQFPGGPHFRGRQKLLEALGFDYAAWEPKGGLDALGSDIDPLARKVIVAFRDLIDNENYVVGVAAIAASESMVPKQYAYLVSLLRQYWPEITEQQMFHLLEHIEHDVHHGNSLDAHLRNAADQTAVKYGKDQAEKAWSEFWREIKSPSRNQPSP